MGNRCAPLAYARRTHILRFMGKKSVSVKKVSTGEPEEPVTTVAERRAEVKRLTSAGLVVRHDLAFNILSVSRPTNLVLLTRRGLLRPYESDSVERYSRTLLLAEATGNADLSYGKVRGGAGDQATVTVAQVRASTWIKHVQQHTPEWSMLIIDVLLSTDVAADKWRVAVQQITEERSEVGQAASVRMACLNLAWSSRVASALLREIH